jgi:hypothetical protein
MVKVKTCTWVLIQISTTWRSSKKWYDEEPDYNYENPGDSTGVVGHFTQMVWKNTC